ncbi:xylose ABC transporter, periplasmic xylose-binding protein XylF [Lachnospiraceae bacterium KM106-2]|nr:xylose ABC transporter, periplasmic xylose-binding protein XylF [Lachnospiraceae bacterium KM106-2]
MEIDKKPTKQIQIGVIFDSFIIERWQRDRDAFVSKAKNELNANVNIQNANGDVKEQVRLINYFIDKKVDVLVIVPIDCEAISDAVKKAKDSGIKIISYDRLIKNADVDLYITFDNDKVGQLMADSMKKAMPENANIIMMCGPKVDNNVGLVTKGFQAGLKGTNIKVAATKHASGWLAETGYDYVSNYLSHHKNVDGIMCGNDGIAGQVIHALSERRLAGKVCVVGQDADLDACQRIVEGTQTMTVYKPVAKLAQLAASYAVQLGKGEKIPYSKTFLDGTNEVPYIGLEPIAITKKNMNIIIEDGFHLKDDIYLNVK